MLTALENKLLELYRACPDEKKFAILDTAQLLCDISSADHDTSAARTASDLSTRQLVDLFNGLSMEYRGKLIRYAMELTILSTRAADPDRQVSAPAPDPETVQTSTRLRDTANKAEIPARYQMTTAELDELLDVIRYDGGDPIDALCFAFDYGFVKGNRATRRGKVKAL